MKFSLQYSRFLNDDATKADAASTSNSTNVPPGNWGTSGEAENSGGEGPRMRIHPDLNAHEIAAAEALARISPLLARVRRDRVD